MNFAKFYYPIVAFFLIISCSQDIILPTNAVLTIEFDNRISSIDDLELGTSVINTVSGEQVHVSELKYIISDIVLYDTNNNAYVYPRDQSQFVVDEEINRSKKIIFKNLPEVRIQKIGFKIGFISETQLANKGLIIEAEKQGLVSRKDKIFKGFSLKGEYTSEGIDRDFDLFTNGLTDSMMDDEEQEIIVNLPRSIDLDEDKENQVKVLARINKVFDSMHAINLETFHAMAEVEKTTSLQDNICSMFVGEN